MTRELLSPRLVDLGRASRRTQGADGKVTDFVAMMERWGISRS